MVLHLAALIGIPYSYRSPATYVDTNITGTLNILQAARDGGCSRVVITSTSQVYGTVQTVPITEELASDLRLLVGRRKTGPILLSNREAALTPRHVNRIVTAAGERAGVKNPNTLPALAGP